MTGRIRLAAAAVALAVLGLGVVLAVNVEGDPATEGGRFVGTRAPAFTVETLDGEQLSLADLAGKTVVVNFWNTWCRPCEEEAPALAELWRRHGDEPDFAMVGIVRDDTERAVREYVAERGIGWTIGFDGPPARAALAYATTGQPETYVIGPDGIVAGEQRTAATIADLELMVRAARGTL
jgi:cytochrome c biogenesis protein CcmG/thiol:disulfide interchange protein DsbE